MWFEEPTDLNRKPGGAQPRDLQFCGPVLGIFFAEAVWTLRPVGLTAKRQPSPARAGASISQHCPSAVGAAHFPLNLHQYCAEKHFQDGPAELQIPRLRSPGFPVEVGGFLELHAPFLTERRTRCRVRCCVTGNPGRDDKGNGGASTRFEDAEDQPQVPPLRCASQAERSASNHRKANLDKCG